MDRDLLLLLGLVFLPLAFVALVSAWADRRRPWAALLLLVIGGVLVIWAHVTHPSGGYDWQTLPGVVAQTIGRYWHR
jgi:hypothetical protein